jgi:hypothetical protein
MDWTLSRERLGAELIGAREDVAARWRLSLRDEGAPAWAVERCAAELVLHAGAALADAMPASTPWRRCGGLLRIDARGHGRALALELTLLWRCMAGTLSQMALSVDEDRRAREVLGQQMEAALRGASAELRAALLDDLPEDPALRFGGVRAVCWNGTEEPPADIRAA